ncbi:MAG TPA: sensor histidine kinase [Bacteroides sp.]|nr:sensor histidine kinase [Bacteroides sp.]
MKTSNQYSAIITLLVMLLAAGGILLSLLVNFRYDFLEYLIPAVTVTAGSFLIIKFFFNRFVEQKINPIFKTIRRHSLAQQELKNQIEKEDIVKELNKEVQVWANNHTEEIKKLKQLEKYRKDFLGNVSHELKTPIFNVQGYILTLLDGGMEDSNVNRLYLKRAEKSINRLISIVDDLDSIARLESGEFKLKMEPFNLVKVAEEVFEDQEMQAKKRNIRLVFDRSYSKPVQVVGDRRRIMEAISNLINNSIKYGKSGGKTTVGFIDAGEHVLVDITDNGIGIEEENLPRIFERFFRVDKSRSRESGGTGLGLSIVKHVIQAHKQTITVRSKVGKGTSFIFSMDKA